MALYEDCIRSGQWLFRHRGFLPLLGVALLFTQIVSVAIPGAPAAVPITWPLVCFGISLVGLAIRAYTIRCAAPAPRAESRHAGGDVAQHHRHIFRRPAPSPGQLSRLARARARSLADLAGGRHQAGVLAVLQRIMFAEEEFLRGRTANRNWSAGRRLHPDFRLWVPPETPFTSAPCSAGSIRACSSSCSFSRPQRCGMEGVVRRGGSTRLARALIFGIVVATAPRGPAAYHPARQAGPVTGASRKTKWPVRQSRTGHDVVAGDAGVPSRLT
jgi:hypothetical protein